MLAILQGRRTQQRGRELRTLYRSHAFCHSGGDDPRRPVGGLGVGGLDIEGVGPECSQVSQHRINEHWHELLVENPRVADLSAVAAEAHHARHVYKEMFASLNLPTSVEIAGI